MTFPQTVLDQLADPVNKGGVNDGPRAMLAWAHEGRMLDQPHRWQPEMGGITENHRIQTAAAWLIHTKCREPRYVEWMVERMALWRREGEQLGEQLTDTYDGHHIAALVGAAAAAIAAGSTVLTAALVEAIELWVALRSLVTDPITLRSGGPGRRCGDPHGRSVQRDVSVCLLTGKHVPGGWRWPLTDQVMMEPRLVAALAPVLPRPFGRTGVLPVLEDAMVVKQYARGYLAFTPVSTMKPGRGGAILWAVAHRSGSGEYESIGWRDLGLPYNEQEARRTHNPRRPYARQMGGGPMPRPLPDMELGAELRTVTVPRAGGASRPPEPPDGGSEEDRNMPDKTAPPTPPPAGPQRHLLRVTDPVTGQPRTLVVETAGPGEAVRYIREHRG